MSPSDSQTGLRLQLLLSQMPGASSAGDVEVVCALVDREEWAVVASWRRYAGLVYRIAERVLGSSREADEATQEAFLCAFEDIRTLREPRAFRGFLVAVAIRTIKRRLRRSRSRSSRRFETAPSSLFAQGAVGESVRRLYALIDRLGVDDRVAFVLRRVDGMSLLDVAQATGESLAKVRRRLTRCHARLARSIDRDGGPDDRRSNKSLGFMRRRARTVTLDARVRGLVELASGHVGAMSDVQKARGMHGMVTAFRRPWQPPRPRPRRRRTVAVAVAAALVLIAASAFGVRALWSVFPKPLTYGASAGVVGWAGSFQFVPAASSSIVFSDGTQLALREGARGRLGNLDARDPRVTLHDGALDADVIAREGARWTFHAGPFSVRAPGSGLWLSWSAARGQLDLQAHRGSVTVTGPLSDSDIVLRPGQWLTVRLAEREVFLREVEQSAMPLRLETPRAKAHTP